MRGAVGPDFPIIFRFSQWKQTDYAASIAADPAELQELLAPLVDAGVDVFHPSTRRHYVPAFPDADPELSLSGWTKKVTGAPVIAVGSVGLESEFTPGGQVAPSRLHPSTACSTSSAPGSSTSWRSDGPCWPTRRGSTGCAMIRWTGSMGMTQRLPWLS